MYTAPPWKQVVPTTHRKDTHIDAYTHKDDNDSNDDDDDEEDDDVVAPFLAPTECADEHLQWR